MCREGLEVDAAYTDLPTLSDFPGLYRNIGSVPGIPEIRRQFPDSLIIDRHSFQLSRNVRDSPGFLLYQSVPHGYAIELLSVPEATDSQYYSLQCTVYFGLITVYLATTAFPYTM